MSSSTGAIAAPRGTAPPPRVLIEGVTPQVDGGQFPAKRVVGDRVVVEADLVADGHDTLCGLVRYHRTGSADWSVSKLEPLVNDRWRGVFFVDALGEWEFSVVAWIDAFGTWRERLEKRIAANDDTHIELLVGADLVSRASERATGSDAERLGVLAAALREPKDRDARHAIALGDELSSLMDRYPDTSRRAEHGPLRLLVERERSRFTAWYELFPRSFGDSGRHGRFRDLEPVLDYVASMGFDVLYLPPVHPIGKTHRKGKNNSLDADLGDPGSPWAIGAAEGGHKAVHPELGTLEDFRWLVARAEERGLEIALDIAFQTSPDHPYVTEHPEWFIKRPDGTIQYAENPPKKYQDVYPFDFECSDYQGLWEELASVFLFWLDQGVRIFRVDNPHTKPIRFWQWCLAEVRKRDPEVVFLSEAFTRPKVKYALAKAGFSMGYTYFTWRNTRWELTEYLKELTRTEVAEFFRPSFWPNTPDILPESLQFGGRPAFVARLVLAATLSSAYGIYGPAFELMDHVARPGSGEYLDNEKYQLRQWPLSSPDSLKDLIGRVNRIRRDNPALWNNHTLEFHPTDNDVLLAYSKMSNDKDNLVLVVVNLDPHYTQSGWLSLDLEALDLPKDGAFQAHDLLTNDRFLWSGDRAYIELDPHAVPAHIFRIRRHVRHEQDFEYFL